MDIPHRKSIGTSRSMLLQKQCKEVEQNTKQTYTTMSNKM